MTILALVIATVIPVIVGYIIYSLDLYKTGSFRYVLICFFWGGIAFFIARVANWIPYKKGLVDINSTIRFVAPVVEEILKAIVLVLLVRRKNFTYFVDGAIYGFGVGIGFAVFENYEYILGNPGASFAIAINRVLSTNLMHAGASAITGIFLGLARFQKPIKMVAYTLLGLALAISVHIGYNNIVSRELGSGFLLLVYAVSVGGGAAGVTIFAIKRGLKEEKAWIEEKLGAADRVERGEVTAVQQLASVDEVLSRLAKVFGDEKAEQIEKLLLTQAKLGILRKSAEKLNDERLRTATQNQVETLHHEMEALRKTIGPYAMSYFRYTHLEEALSIYTILTTRLQERAKSNQAPKFDVFSALGKSFPKKPESPEK